MSRLHKLFAYIRHSIEDRLVERTLTEPYALLPQKCLQYFETLPDDSHILNQFHTLRRDILDRVDTSHLVYVLHGDQLAGFIWATKSPRYHEGEHPFLYKVCPKADSSYLYDLYVLPNYRGQKIADQLMRRILNSCLLRGSKTAFYSFDKKNTALARQCEKLGFQAVGSISYQRKFFRVSQDLSDLSKVCTS